MLHKTESKQVDAYIAHLDGVAKFVKEYSANQNIIADIKKIQSAIETNTDSALELAICGKITELYAELCSFNPTEFICGESERLKSKIQAIARLRDQVQHEHSEWETKLHHAINQEHKKLIEYEEKTKQLNQLICELKLQFKNNFLIKINRLNLEANNFFAQIMQITRTSKNPIIHEFKCYQLNNFLNKKLIEQANKIKSRDSKKINNILNHLEENTDKARKLHQAFQTKVNKLSSLNVDAQDDEKKFKISYPSTAMKFFQSKLTAIDEIQSLKDLLTESIQLKQKFLEQIKHNCKEFFKIGTVIEKIFLIIANELNNMKPHSGLGFIKKLNTNNNPNAVALNLALTTALENIEKIIALTGKVNLDQEIKPLVKACLHFKASTKQPNLKECLNKLGIYNKVKKLIYTELQPECLSKKPKHASVL